MRYESKDFKDFDEQEITRQITDFMTTNEIFPFGALDFKIDGQIHRFRTREDKPGEMSGAYQIHDTGIIPAGFVQDWRKGKFNWKFNGEASPAVVEVKEERQKKNVQEEPKTLSHELFEKSQQITELDLLTFPYLKRKKLRRWCFLQNTRVTPRRQLIIALPRLDLNGEVIAYQTIDQDGGKRMLSGSKLGECAAIYPENPCSYYNAGTGKPWGFDDIYVCEGIATGAALFEIIKEVHKFGNFRFMIACAMSAHNLMTVCKTIKAQSYSHGAKVIIAADNDDAGINAAKDVIKAGHANGMKLPPKGNDFSDYLAEERN